MTWEFLLAQGCGLVVLVLAIITPQFKKMAVVAVMEMLINLLTAAQYLLLGASIGWLTGLSAALYCLLLYFVDRYLVRGKKVCRAALTVLYLASYVVIVVRGYSNPYDLFPLATAALFALSLVQKKVLGYNVCTVVKSFANISYQYFTGAYSLILAQSFVLLSSVVAIVRKLREEKKNK
jgi:hypothetical protein